MMRDGFYRLLQNTTRYIDITISRIDDILALMENGDILPPFDVVAIDVVSLLARYTYNEVEFASLQLEGYYAGGHLYTIEESNEVVAELDFYRNSGHFELSFDDLTVIITTLNRALLNRKGELMTIGWSGTILYFIII